MSENETKYLLGFSLLPGIGPSRFEKIKKHFSNLESAWNSDTNEFLKAGVEEKIVENFRETKNKINLDEEFEKTKNEGIQIIGKDDKSYPERLKEIKQSPFILFCKGNTSLLKEKQIAVVGTRNPTPYGKDVVKKIVPEIAISGFVITSGLAFGVDSLAHRAALDNNQSTIAVLAHGLDEKNLKDSTSFALCQEIISKNSLLVSEYPPGFGANKNTFPARNRIISGLSMGILVVEAGEKSGTLITANYALEQNREIFAIPGNIFSPQSAGTNFLLKQGAKVVTSSKDILESFNFVIPDSFEKQQKIEFSDEIEEKIYKKLSYEPIHIDKLAKILDLNIATISTKLSLMELTGTARNVGGGFIRG